MAATNHATDRATDHATDHATEHATLRHAALSPPLSPSPLFTATVAPHTQILPLKRYCDVVEKDLVQIATTRSWIRTRQAVLGQKPPEPLDASFQAAAPEPDDGGDGYYNGPEMMPPDM